MAERFDDLKRLSDMLAKGEIDQSEYDKLKAELLAEESATQEVRDPGWYDDPSGGATHQAYWDGGKWTGTTRPPPTDAVPGKNANIPWYRTTWFVLTAFGVVLFILLAINGFSLEEGGGSGGGSGGGGSGGPDNGDAVGAYVVCQQFVEDDLKAPASADFGGPYSAVTQSLGGGRYRVDTYVDSQNSFGALVRTDFVCTVDHQNGDTYRLESLTFSD